MGMLGDNRAKEFQIYPWSKEIEEGSTYLEKGMKTSNPEERSEILILRELNPPKNQRIPQRNQEIAKRGF
jgi:hypothetical protein